MQLFHGLLTVLILSACASPIRAPSYPGDTLHEDVSTVIATLEDAYAQRRSSSRWLGNTFGDTLNP